MTELQRYLAEEVAEDHADGIITRREAFRRLGLLGLSAGAASSLLAGFAQAAQAKGSRRSHGSHGPHRRDDTVKEWAPVPAESITFAGPRVPLLGAWAPATHPRGGILVIHENRGLTAHIRSVASRLAAGGYSALAVDLVSEEGGTDAIGDEGRVAAILGGAPVERLVEDMQAALTELARRLPGKDLSAVGFCFGGAMVWELLAAERRLSAAAPFYGPFPEGRSLKRSDAAVLAVYGGLDTRVNASRDAAHEALHAARLKHEVVTFTEADHAFFNDTGARFNPPAAAEAHRRLLAWLDRFVAGHDEHGDKRDSGHHRDHHDD